MPRSQQEPDTGFPQIDGSKREIKAQPTGDHWKWVRDRNGYAIQEKDGKLRTVPLHDKHLKT